MRIAIVLVFGAALSACSAFNGSQEQEDIVEQFARLDVTWREPHTYSDVRAFNQPDEHFRNRTIRYLSAYMAKLSQNLPQGQSLSITISDLDLAGRRLQGDFSSGDGDDVGQRLKAVTTNIQYKGAPNELRFLSTSYPPRLTFEYQLTDSKGQVLKQGSEQLVDEAFLDRHSPSVDNRHALNPDSPGIFSERFRKQQFRRLHFEKVMLEQWFDQTFRNPKNG